VSGSRIRLVLVAALATSMLAGCSGAPNILSSDAGWFDKPIFTARNWQTNSGPRTPLSSRPVGPEDLLTADGSCPVSPGALAATDNAPGAPADAAMPSGGGVALDMSECEVVRRVGAPERFEVGNDAGHRTVLLTYLRGARPGIYRFVDGRLVSVERAPEAPAPTRPQRPAKRGA
jgi:hypothetical protein